MNVHLQGGEPRFGNKSGLVCKDVVVRGRRLQPRYNDYGGYKVEHQEILDVYE